MELGTQLFLVLQLLTGVEAFFLSIAESHELSAPSKDLDNEEAALIQLPGTTASCQPLDTTVTDRQRPGYGVRPKYWYNLNRDGGIIEIGTTERPELVLMWYAYTYKGTKGRDFRWFTLDDGKW